MKFDVPSARVRIGLQATDNSKDTEIKFAMDFALAVVEQYTDRRFAWQVDTVRFYLTTSATFILPRAPITRLRTITTENGQDVGSNQYQVHYQNAVLMFDSQYVTRTLEVIYEGGFQEFPADLRVVLWALFDTAWNKYVSGTVQTATAGEIDSITVPDVGTIRYSGGSLAGLDLESSSGVYFKMLEPYRRIYA